jgi:hypothetical protein
MRPSKIKIIIEKHKDGYVGYPITQAGIPRDEFLEAYHSS